MRSKSPGGIGKFEVSIPPSKGSGSRDFYRLGREISHLPPFGAGAEEMEEGELKRIDAFVTSVWASTEDLARQNEKGGIAEGEGWFKGIKVKREIEMGIKIDGEGMFIGQDGYR